MTIETLSEHKVLISLCSEDMQDYKLQFSDMSFVSEHSRKVLLRLMRLACRRAGFVTESKTVLMEAIPHKGGCLLLVTLCDKKHRRTYKVKRIKEYPCFVFENADMFFEAAAQMYRRGITMYDNSLWEYNGKVYIITDYPVLSLVAKSLLQEYSGIKMYTKVVLSRIKESGRLLCDHNAVEKIGRIMSS